MNAVKCRCGEGMKYDGVIAPIGRPKAGHFVCPNSHELWKISPKTLNSLKNEIEADVLTVDQFKEKYIGL